MAGILANALLLWWPIRQRALSGANDFASFYAAGRLAGTQHLYDAARNRQLAAQHSGFQSDAWRFIRPPFFAGLLWPLARLPYRAAYATWELLSVAAILGFVTLWRPPRIPLTLVAACWNLPLLSNLSNGQDVTFLLFWIAAAACLHRRGRSLAAGLVFSLCAAKFHLFVLLPVLLLARNLRRFAVGLLLGGAILLALSFLAGGPSWPQRYYAALTDPTVHPSPAVMPNLRGLLTAWGLGRAWLPAFGLPVVLAVWWIARRMPLEYGLAGVLIGGVLLNLHSYVHDAALLLPAVLAVASITSSFGLRAVAVFLFTPVPYFLLLSGDLFAQVFRVTVVLALCLMAGEAWCRSRPGGRNGPGSRTA